MTPRIMKWLSMAILFVGLLAQSSSGYRIVLDLVVCVAALVVFYQAIQSDKYLWAAGFFSIAVLFNPAVPLTLSGRVFFWLDLACIMTFAISLAALRSRPRLSISGIISPHRQIESL
jgi:hypothetical protein